MICAIGCRVSPVVGVANIAGLPGTPVAGIRDSYPLCAYHYTELIEGRWGNVKLLGWEPLPTSVEVRDETGSERDASGREDQQPE